MGGVSGGVRWMGGVSGGVGWVGLIQGTNLQLEGILHIITCQLQLRGSIRFKDSHISIVNQLSSGYYGDRHDNKGTLS